MRSNKTEANNKRQSPSLINRSRPLPVAPPAYRPQPVPVVLQRKIAPGSPLSRRPEPVPNVVQARKVAEQKRTTAMPPKAPPVPRVPQPQNSQHSATLAALRSGSAREIVRPATIQRHRVNVFVTGITHLVAKQGRSIYRGEEGPEVSEGMQLEIETSGRIRSRRGPNQELFGKYDMSSTRNYGWLKVMKVSGQDVSQENLYVREDTVTPNMPGSLPVRLQPRATRQRDRGDKLVRFEVWYNTDRSIDGTGHLVMFDYERRTHFEIAQKRDASDKLIPRVAPRKRQPAWMIEPVDYHDVIKGASAKSIAYEMRVTESTKDKTKLRLRAQTRKQGPRFNRRSYVDVQVSAREYLLIRKMLATRILLGDYYFAYEARAHNPLASRCLSTLEDIGELRGYTLQQGHAFDVLTSFIQQAAIVDHETLSLNHKPA